MAAETKAAKHECDEEKARYDAAEKAFADAHRDEGEGDEPTVRITAALYFLLHSHDHARGGVVVPADAHRLGLARREGPLHQMPRGEREV